MNYDLFPSQMSIRIWNSCEKVSHKHPPSRDTEPITVMLWLANAANLSHAFPPGIDSPQIPRVSVLQCPWRVINSNKNWFWNCWLVNSMHNTGEVWVLALAMTRHEMPPNPWTVQNKGLCFVSPSYNNSSLGRAGKAFLQAGQKCKIQILCSTTVQAEELSLVETEFRAVLLCGNGWS